MAIKSTIYKAELAIADIDHSHYATYELTLARHPSETDERMMIRLVALAFEAWQLQSLCNGDATLSFGKGLSDPDEPDVWLRDYTNEIKVWVEVGQPEEKPVAKACGKAENVRIYCYHHAAHVWWQGLANKMARYDKLKVFNIPSQQSLAAAAMAQRSMQLTATIQDGGLTLSSEMGTVTIEPQIWK